MAEISVVVPSYNRAQLIGQTLDAILSQSLRPDEIIVVDDGSSDDTQSVLASYGDRLRALRISNSGDLVARNTGLRAAHGRLVAFCDSDDLWSEDFLATMSAQWRAVPELLSCYADFRVLRDGVLSEHSKFEEAPDTFWSELCATAPDAGVFGTSIVERLLWFQPFFPSCMMVSRTEFLSIGGWDESVSRTVGCDLATILRVAAQPPLGVVRRPLVTIRKHADNFSSDSEKMNLGDATVLEHVLRSRPELAYLESAIRFSIADRRLAGLDSAFSRRNFADVRDIYRLLLPGERPVKHRIKRAIAALPSPLNRLAAAAVSRQEARRQKRELT